MFRTVPTEEPDSLTAAKSYAFRLLSRRPYSRVESVSYTHLDVYKRQNQGR